VPSTIGVSAFGGNSLFGLFTASIGENLAKFPQGPSIDDKFWLYLLTWHVGLFLTMTYVEILPPRFFFPFFPFFSFFLSSPSSLPPLLLPALISSPHPSPSSPTSPTFFALSSHRRAGSPSPSPSRCRGRKNAHQSFNPPFLSPKPSNPSKTHHRLAQIGVQGRQDKYW
jgi:photosystem I protein PsaO